MSTVIVIDGERENVYRVVDRSSDDQRMVIEKFSEPLLADIRRREGSRQMTAKEFKTHFGHLPTDDEG